MIDFKPFIGGFKFWAERVRTPTRGWTRSIIVQHVKAIIVTPPVILNDVLSVFSPWWEIELGKIMHLRKSFGDFVLHHRKEPRVLWI